MRMSFLEASVQYTENSIYTLVFAIETEYASMRCELNSYI
jgi:hypothetical protein